MEGGGLNVFVDDVDPGAAGGTQRHLMCGVPVESKCVRSWRSFEESPWRDPKERAKFHSE